MKRTYRKSTSTPLTCSVFIVCSILPLKIMVNCVFSCFEPGFIVVINTCTGTGAKMVYSLWLQRLFLLFVRYRHVQYNSKSNYWIYSYKNVLHQKLPKINPTERNSQMCNKLFKLKKQTHTKKHNKKRHNVQKFSNFYKLISLKKQQQQDPLLALLPLSL